MNKLHALPTEMGTEALGNPSLSPFDLHPLLLKHSSFGVSKTPGATSLGEEEQEMACPEMGKG